ncbi:MAG TPA: hypothetical protein VFL95_08230 [Gemmatimonadales bacterium]|nr:hypothetical protein [Gemmatimonadales bacterium]
MNRPTRFTSAVGIVVVLLAMAHTLPAQTFGARVGLTSYDLSGTGTGVVFSAFRTWSVQSDVFVTGSLPLFDKARTERFNGFVVANDISLLLPEFTVGLRHTFGRIEPMVGVGAGWAIKLRGTQRGGATLHATLGTGFRIGENTALTLTAVARSVRPWSGSMVDLMAGVEIGHW